MKPTLDSIKVFEADDMDAPKCFRVIGHIFFAAALCKGRDELNAALKENNIDPLTIAALAPSFQILSHDICGLYILVG